jgi:hypothetical protein
MLHGLKLFFDSLILLCFQRCFDLIENKLLYFYNFLFILYFHCCYFISSLTQVDILYWKYTPCWWMLYPSQLLTYMDSFSSFIFINMRHAASDTNSQYDSPRHEIRLPQSGSSPAELVYTSYVLIDNQSIEYVRWSGWQVDLHSVL